MRTSEVKHNLKQEQKRPQGLQCLFPAGNRVTLDSSPAYYYRPYAF